MVLTLFMVGLLKFSGKFIGVRTKRRRLSVNSYVFIRNFGIIFLKLVSDKSFQYKCGVSTVNSDVNL